MLLVLKIQVLRATEDLKPCGAMWSFSEGPSHSVHPLHLCFFSSGRPRLCHLAARWLRLDWPGPSAFGNAR